MSAGDGSEALLFIGPGHYAQSRKRAMDELSIASAPTPLPRSFPTNLKTPASPALQKDPSGRRWQTPGICLALALLIAAIYAPVRHFEFLNYDDDVYVTVNPTVQAGLTSEGFRWAMTANQIGHWHPLTWLSHMLDCEYFGMNAGGPHVINVLLHAATAILLFLVLRKMTGAIWPSALAAALFAIHPQRVESVAWISERKD